MQQDETVTQMLWVALGTYLLKLFEAALILDILVFTIGYHQAVASQLFSGRCFA